MRRLTRMDGRAIKGGRCDATFLLSCPALFIKKCIKHQKRQVKCANTHFQNKEGFYTGDNLVGCRSDGFFIYHRHLASYDAVVRSVLFVPG